MTVKYTSARPDEGRDALQTLEEDWTHPEKEPDAVLVVARVYRYGIAKTQRGGSDWQATAGLGQVEILTGADAVEAERMLNRAFSQRTGETQLPIPDGATLDLGDPVGNVTDGPWSEPDGDTDGAA